MDPPPELFDCDETVFAMDEDVLDSGRGACSVKLSRVQSLLSAILGQPSDSASQKAMLSRLQHVIGILSILRRSIGDIEANLPSSDAEPADGLCVEGFRSVEDVVRSLSADQVERVSPRVVIQTSLSALLSVTFVYCNNPLNGWEKHICLRLGGGKTRGRSDVRYVAPLTGRRLRSKPELLLHAERAGLPASFADQFDFRQVFCVCQTPQSPHRNYLECSFGYCGCNSWVHPECVGLGHQSLEQLQHMGPVICPLCTAYLEGAGKLDEQREEATALRDICLGHNTQELVFRGFRIEESSVAHRLWGLEGSACSYSLDGNAEPTVPMHMHPSIQACSISPGGAAIDEGTAAVEEAPEQHEIVSLNKRRRTLTMPDGGTVQLGLIGGYLQEVCGSASRPSLLTSSDISRHSAAQISHYNQFMDVAQLAMRGYRQSARSRSRHRGKPQPKGSRDDGSNSAIPLWLPLQDGGVRACIANFQSKCPALTLKSRCVEHSICAFCLLPISSSDGVMRDELALHEQCQLVFDVQFFSSMSVTVNVVDGVATGSEQSKEDDSDADSSESSSCSLCGHQGGLLFSFSIGSHCCQLIDRTSVGFRGHAPCIRAFDAALSSEQCEAISQAPGLQAVTGCLRGFISSSGMEGFTLSDADDELLAAKRSKRCVLCATDEGLLWKCFHVHCAVYVHPLCAHLDEGATVAGWQAVQASASLSVNSRTVVGFLCCLHR